LPATTNSDGRANAPADGDEQDEGIGPGGPAERGSHPTQAEEEAIAAQNVAPANAVHDEAAEEVSEEEFEVPADGFDPPLHSTGTNFSTLLLGNSGELRSRSTCTGWEGKPHQPPEKEASSIDGYDNPVFCRLFVKYGEGENYVCSASLVGESLIATARHCTFNPCTSRSKASRVEVACGYEGEDGAHYGTALAYGCTFHTNYDTTVFCRSDGKSSTHFPLDFQICKLDRPLGANLGYLGTRVKQVSNVNMRGYPGDIDHLSDYFSGIPHTLLDHYTESKYDSDYQYQIHMPSMYAWGGESGSPLYEYVSSTQSRFLVGVFCGGYNAGCGMFGREVTSQWSDIVRDLRLSHNPGSYCQVIRQIRNPWSSRSKQEGLGAPGHERVSSYVYIDEGQPFNAAITLFNVGNKAAGNIRIVVKAGSYTLKEFSFVSLPEYYRQMYFLDGIKPNWRGSSREITVTWYTSESCKVTDGTTHSLGSVYARPTPSPTRYPTRYPTPIPTRYPTLAPVSPWVPYNIDADSRNVGFVLVGNGKCKQSRGGNSKVVCKKNSNCEMETCMKQCQKNKNCIGAELDVKTGECRILIGGQLDDISADSKKRCFARDKSSKVSTLDFDYIGEGWCRTQSGGSGSFKRECGGKKKACSLGACMGKCKSVKNCLGVEYWHDRGNDSGSCELHQAILTKTQSARGVRCFSRGPDKEVVKTTFKLVGKGYCRGKDGSKNNPKMACTKATPCTEAECMGLCRSWDRCVGIEFWVNDGVCELHDSEVVKIKKSGASLCYSHEQP